MSKWLLLVVSGILACETNSDCDKGFECRSGSCKKDFFPLSSYEILSTALVFVTSGMAGATGIGGGALFVIYFVTLCGLNASNAVALSQFTIMGSSFMAAFIKMFLRHPIKNKPLINYDIIIIIICPLLIGTSLGVIVNIILPYWLILLILTMLLAFLSQNTIKAGVNQYRKETLAQRQDVLMEIHEDQYINQQLQKIYANEKRILPWDSMLIILPIYIFVIMCSLMRGSRRFSSIVGLEFCTPVYWVVSCLIILALLGILICCTKYLIKKHHFKVTHGYEFDVLDIKWDTKGCRLISIAGFLAGFIGSIVGVGGALMVNPVLIKIGIRPEVMTATSSFMIVFTSTISSLQFIIEGKIDLNYGLWNIIFSLCGSAFGVFIIKTAVERYKRSSLIIISLGFVMILCAVVIPIYGILTAINKETDFGFHNYCS